MVSKKNTISRKDARRLEDLILKMKKEIERGSWTQEDFSVYATKTLKVQITKSNVVGCASTVEVKFPKSKPQRADKSVYYRRSVQALRMLQVLGLEMVRVFEDWDSKYKTPTELDAFLHEDLSGLGYTNGSVDSELEGDE